MESKDRRDFKNCVELVEMYWRTLVGAWSVGGIEHIDLFLYLQVLFFTIVFASWYPSQVSLLS